MYQLKTIYKKTWVEREQICLVPTEIEAKGNRNGKKHGVNKKSFMYQQCTDRKQFINKRCINKNKSVMYRQKTI